MLVKKNNSLQEGQLEINLLESDILKVAFKKIQDVAKYSGVVKSVLLRGSLSIGGFDKDFNDIDLSFILSQDHTIKDIFDIQLKLKKFGEGKGLDISISFIDEAQLIEDSQRKVHFHGRKSAVYSKEIAKAILIYGDDVRKIFTKCDSYNLLDIYRESCDLISHFHKDILSNTKKGIKFSVILAKKCLNCINFFPSDKAEIITWFSEKINAEKGGELKEIQSFRSQLKLSINDLEKIYSVLMFCRNFIFNQIDSEEYKNLIQRRDG